MFVKIYEYNIKKDKEVFFLEIQKKAVQIYKEYLCCDVTFLKSINDETMWMEISRFSSHKEYSIGIQKVNNEPVIIELYEQFESCLVPERQNIRKSDFVVKLQL